MMLRKVVAKTGETVYLRPAVAEDAADFIRAVDGVAREGAYFLRSRFEVNLEAEQTMLASASDRGDLILIARAEGEVVGWVTLLHPRAEFMQHTADLGMGVVGPWRGRGIGSALMQYALEYAAERGIEKVRLGVRSGNARAEALYHAFGFVEEGYRLRDVKDLEGCYHDIIEMSWFAPSPVPAAQEGGSGA
jgi:ribosomal protein S18 acetylase RimI-like enzyme